MNVNDFFQIAPIHLWDWEPKGDDCKIIVYNISLGLLWRLSKIIHSLKDSINSINFTWKFTRKRKKKIEVKKHCTLVNQNEKKNVTNHND